MAKKTKMNSIISDTTKPLKSSTKKRHRDAESPDFPPPSSPTSPSPKSKKRKKEQHPDSDLTKSKKRGANKDDALSPEISAQEHNSKIQTKKKGAVSANGSNAETETKDIGAKKSKNRRSRSPVTSSTITSNLRNETKSDVASKNSKTKLPGSDGDGEETLSSTAKNKRVTPQDTMIPSPGKQIIGERSQKRDKSTIYLNGESPSTGRKRKHQETSHEQKQAEDDPATKHAKIMRKFEKSTKNKKSKIEENDKTKESNKDIEEGTAVVAKGLEPLPQPQPAPEKDEKPTYSTMPNWITNPVTKSPHESKDGKPLGFGTLNLDRAIVSKLEKHGYKEATAVQATVIPLLIDRAYRHHGDLCVSASTGSGKTLSYVLPMDQSLERESLPKFRGLIVVPTRELVKQAREAFEACGSNLRIGTAVGNVALKDEQHKLTRWDHVYNPEKFVENQQKMLAGDDWANFDLLKYKDQVQRSENSLPLYIQVPQPNVDVLITTPGRLVDHIRQTEGFSLRYLQWLVIDEADRLLNESFQEWVSVLMTELEKAKSVNLGGPVMDSMGHPLKSPDPKKVILSATLTNDITKLNSLRLNNPKLVAIGLKESETETTDAVNESEQFVLPSTLEEHYVPVDDGSEKPIHLMRLLLQEINKSTWSSIATPAYNLEKVESLLKHDASASDATSESDDTSSSGTDTSDSDSDSDSESESESESDSSSASSSESSSGSDSDDESEATSTSESESESESESDSDGASVDESTAKPIKRSKNDATSVLIFTKSTESAARLSLLLGLMNPSLKSKIGTIVKSNNSSSSRKTLRNYRAGKVKIIVATDRASRGIDLVDLGAVINYDIPTSITTYVHRVGRTARAGKSGHAWTLVEHREGLWFQKVIVKSENVVRAGKVAKYAQSTKNTKAMKSEFTAALEQLEKAVKG